MRRENLSRKDWEAGLTGDERRCRAGCVAIIAACLAVDAIAVWALLNVLQSAAQFFAWLLSLMAAV